MNKIIIPIIVIVIIAAGIGAFVIFQKPALPKSKTERDYFFEVHMEPQNAVKESSENSFNELSEFVGLANSYSIKLTILFTPQWINTLLNDSKKIGKMDEWRKQGHEIGGHHHGPTICPWDGYTNLDIASQEFKDRQKRVPCPKTIRADEKYFGDMDDYLKVIRKIGEIKTITMSDEDVDCPSENIYSAGDCALTRRFPCLISSL